MIVPANFSENALHSLNKDAFNKFQTLKLCNRYEPEPINKLCNYGRKQSANPTYQFSEPWLKV